MKMKFSMIREEEEEEERATKKSVFHMCEKFEVQKKRRKGN